MFGIVAEVKRVTVNVKVAAQNFLKSGGKFCFRSHDGNFFAEEV